MEHIKTKTVTKSNFETVNQARSHTILMDNMPENGGQDFAASPKEHLCMALGACTTMTIQTFLTRKQWACSLLEANTTYQMKNEKPSFNIQITIHGNFDERQQKRIIQIAKFCPIQKMLSPGCEIHETFEFIE